MQKLFTLIFLSIFYFSGFAQLRYKDELFAITKHADIQYGSNYDNKNQLTNLLMDVYEPQDDTATFRPIIFFVHGGSFVGGDRTDQGINKTAEFFTKKGYVTANIEYRVEQSVLISPFLNFADPYNWYRAIARATQDLKAAIRYIKKDVATNNNFYKVDTNSIFIYGSSAGAITMLHTVFLDDTAEMNFWFKAGYNTTGGFDGNSGNPGYTTKGIKAVVSCSGAISDVNFINNNRNIQYLAFHNNPDLTVPFDAGCFITVACHFGQFYGDNRIFPKVRSLGTYAEFYPINYVGHPVDRESDTATHRFVLQKTTDFLYRIMNQNITTAIRNNSVKTIELFPNPSNGNITIAIPNEIRNKNSLVEVVNIEGQKVYSSTIQNKETLQLQLDVPNGMYIVSIVNDDENYLSKITINR
ncbi:MAG: T9SS type A sorting domain-containing protein [Saprospirales bacterium]|nr:T9SS type A sorting domain-containing protein [Saprospirales bacterium]